MLKSSELRIGNYVLDQIGEVYSIKDGQDIDTAKLYNPIPLTEELILSTNAEFIKDDSGIDIYEIDYSCPRPENAPSHRLTFRIMKHDFGYWFILENQTQDKNGVNLGTFYYLHQLQNIWFDLTRQELTLKNKP